MKGKPTGEGGGGGGGGDKCNNLLSIEDIKTAALATFIQAK